MENIEYSKLDEKVNTVKHTKVDEMMLEMIKPKMDEISAKFTNNQKLDKEDINTLLIKAQFNHIEHLDIKLDEVTASVVSLKGDFSGLEGKFFKLENSVNSKISALENNVNAKISALENNVYAKISTLENKFLKLENKVDKRISGLDIKISELKTDINTKISGLEKKVDSLGTDMKIAIKEGIITNMKFTLGTIGLIAAIFKILDIYKI